MGFRQDGDHYAVDYPEDDGTVTKVPLTGKVSDTGIVLDDGSWRWQFDALTLALNGYLDPDSLDFDKILALRLYLAWQPTSFAVSDTQPRMPTLRRHCKIQHP